jgi:hypothetical protein
MNVTLYCHGNPDIVDIMAIKGVCPDNVTFQLHYVRTFFQWTLAGKGFTTFILYLTNSMEQSLS